MDDEDWDSEITEPASIKSAAHKTQSSFSSGFQSTTRAINDQYNNIGRVNVFSAVGGRGQLINRNQNDGANRGFSSYSSKHQNDQNNNFSDSQNKSAFLSSSSSGITGIMQIESRSISAIIGKAGATINHIKDKCHVKVITPSRDEAQSQRTADIKIIGDSREDVEQAKRMIQDVLDSNSNRVSIFLLKKNKNFKLKFVSF